jgi:hypothetical protein
LAGPARAFPDRSALLAAASSLDDLRAASISAGSRLTILALGLLASATTTSAAQAAGSVSPLASQLA